MAGWRPAVRDLKRLAHAHETKVRFLAAGGVNTAFGLAIFPVLMWTLGPRGLHYMIALLISQITSVTLAYTTQKFLVFRTKGNYLPEFGRFILFYLSYCVVNLAALPFLVEVAHVRPIIAQFCFSLMVIVTSYFWHSRITFKPQGLGR
jgi:putative flippase GtrA